MRLYVGIFQTISRDVIPASHANLSSSVAVRPAQSSEQKEVY